MGEGHIQSSPYLKSAYSTVIIIMCSAQDREEKRRETLAER